MRAARRAARAGARVQAARQQLAQCARRADCASPLCTQLAPHRCAPGLAREVEAAVREAEADAAARARGEHLQLKVENVHVGRHGRVRVRGAHVVAVRAGALVAHAQLVRADRQKGAAGARVELARAWRGQRRRCSLAAGVIVAAPRGAVGRRGQQRRRHQLLRAQAAAERSQSAEPSRSIHAELSLCVCRCSAGGARAARPHLALLKPLSFVATMGRVKTKTVKKARAACGRCSAPVRSQKALANARRPPGRACSACVSALARAPGGEGGACTPLQRCGGGVRRAHRPPGLRCQP
jgi:hypothetical protein